MWLWPYDAINEFCLYIIIREPLVGFSSNLAAGKTVVCCASEARLINYLLSTSHLTSNSLASLLIPHLPSTNIFQTYVLRRTITSKHSVVSVQTLTSRPPNPLLHQQFLPGFTTPTEYYMEYIYVTFSVFSEFKTPFLVSLQLTSQAILNPYFLPSIGFTCSSAFLLK